jgi:hypothetical protein
MRAESHQCMPTGCVSATNLLLPLSQFGQAAESKWNESRCQIQVPFAQSRLHHETM